MFVFYELPPPIFLVTPVHLVIKTYSDSDSEKSLTVSVGLSSRSSYAGRFTINILVDTLPGGDGNGRPTLT